MITNTKKQRLKIYSRGQILKNTILKKITKIIKQNIKFALNIGSFFGKVMVIKMKIKGVIKGLK